jgi:hypothetical protein
MSKIQYQIIRITDTLVLIRDLNQGASITNYPSETLNHLSQRHSIKWKRIFYRDTIGRFDQIVHNNGIFVCFRPGSPAQQSFFDALLQKRLSA